MAGIHSRQTGLFRPIVVSHVRKRTPKQHNIANLDLTSRGKLRTILLIILTLQKRVNLSNVVVCRPSMRGGFYLVAGAVLGCHLRTLDLSGVGKSFGIGIVTFPVAAHSVPRKNVVWKPTHSNE